MAGESVLDGEPLSATQIFADLGGGETPRAPRAVKPAQQLVQAAAAPFNLAGMAFALAGDSELAEVMPLSPEEEKRVADALYTVTRNNPALTAALERSGPGLSMLHLGVTLVAVLAPRINTVKQIHAQRRQVNELERTFNDDDSGNPPVPSDGGSGGTPSGSPANPATPDAGNGSAADQSSPPDGRNVAFLRAHAVKPSPLH